MICSSRVTIVVATGDFLFPRLPIRKSSGFYLPYRAIPIRRSSMSMRSKSSDTKRKRNIACGVSPSSPLTVVDEEVAVRRALAMRRVLDDNGGDGSSVRDFSFFTTKRGDTLFTQSWTPVVGSVENRGLVVLLHGLNEHRYSDFAKQLNVSGFKVYGLDWIDIQRVFRSGHLHPQPRILCLQGSPDGPEQYVAVMNSIFSAQRLMVPIDSCYIGTQNSAFLQQASYITGGVHHTPKQLDGLFQYLTTIFATDLHTRGFVQLPKPIGVDFRASCFCHKKTIDMGYICSVCLSIFCEHHKKCSTCGSVFGQSKLDDASSVSDKKRKAPDT